MSEDKLDACGCCEQPEDAALDNPPGQPTLRWRLGRHADFFRRMTAQIPIWPGEGGPALATRPLAGLTTRALDDPSIAMLDAGSVVCDILTFYQERILNEGYLRTATERRSVLELARAIGYELNPGVAAGTYVAFTVDDPPRPVPITAVSAKLPSPPPPILTPTTITISEGTKLQSIPGAGAMPQTFETVETIEARIAWNAMRPRQTQRQYLSIEGGTVKLRDPSGTVVGSSGVLTQAPARRCGTLWLAGTSTGLKVGDVLIVQVTKDNVDPGDPISAGGALGGVAVSGVSKGLAIMMVTAVTADDENKRTRVDLKQDTPSRPLSGLADRADAAVTIDPISLSSTTVRDEIVSKEWDETNLAAFLDIQRWDAGALTAQVSGLLAAVPPAADVHVFRQRLGVFGNGAPPSSTLQGQIGNVWPDFDSSSSGKSPVSIWKQTSDATAGTVTRSYTLNSGADVYLDRAVSGLVPSTFVGLQRPGQPLPQIFAISSTVEVSRSDFTISAKSTGLTLKSGALSELPSQWLSGAITKDEAYKMRTTSVLAQSELLAVTDAPIDEPVGDPAVDGNGGVTWTPSTRVMLDRMVLGLGAGRVVAISGATTNADGTLTGSTASELATISKVIHSGGYAVITFTQALAHVYDRLTMAVSANVARATHGETQPVNRPPGGLPLTTATGAPATGLPVSAGTPMEEVLGSGDGSLANQRFVLKRPPLTYVSAATPSGGASTLTVRVNDVEWTEVASLYGQALDARVYIVRIEDDGGTSITFGDGVAGARLPTGRDNVTAVYRCGIGVAGEVDAGQITLLQSKPLGLKGVINPVAATGGQDAEQLEDARVNAPRTVRTLDRVVSLSDYEDFARSFAGIGKAQATAVWSGTTRLVHITIASSSGDVIDPLSVTYTNLVSGLAAASDRSQMVQVSSFSPRLFKLDVTFWFDPAYDGAVLLVAARTALEAAFAFEARAFAQPVTEAEVMKILHGVTGVVAVKLNQLYRATDPSGSLTGVLVASPAKFDPTTHTVLPAELLLAQPAGLTITAVES